MPQPATRVEVNRSVLRETSVDARDHALTARLIAGALAAAVEAITAGEAVTRVSAGLALTTHVEVLLERGAERLLQHDGIDELDELVDAPVTYRKQPHVRVVVAAAGLSPIPPV
jgi:hypothetical protein